MSSCFHRDFFCHVWECITNYIISIFLPLDQLNHGSLWGLTTHRHREAWYVTLIKMGKFCLAVDRKQIACIARLSLSCVLNVLQFWRHCLKIEGILLEMYCCVLCFEGACESSAVCCISPHECSSTIQKCHTVGLKLGGICFFYQSADINRVTQLGVACYNNINKMNLAFSRKSKPKCVSFPATSAPLPMHP